MSQYSDPEVTKSKFEKEVEEFRQNEASYKTMGVICTKVNFPVVNLIFAIPRLNPSPIAFSVSIDYTNWDTEPPSIKFIDPFTEKKIENRGEIKINFYQVKDKNQIQVSINGQIAELDLLQNASPPFLCIPGVKEYHDHHAHSGDSWMLYRNKGEGTLCTLIEQLHKHSVAQSGGLHIVQSFSIGGISTDINKLRL